MLILPLPYRDMRHPYSGALGNPHLITAFPSPFFFRMAYRRTLKRKLGAIDGTPLPGIKDEVERAMEELVGSRASPVTTPAPAIAPLVKRVETMCEQCGSTDCYAAGGSYICSACGNRFGVVFCDALPQRHSVDEDVRDSAQVHSAVPTIQMRMTRMGSDGSSSSHWSWQPVTVLETFVEGKSSPAEERETAARAARREAAAKRKERAAMRDLVHGDHGVLAFLADAERAPPSEAKEGLLPVKEEGEEEAKEAVAAAGEGKEEKATGGEEEEDDEWKDAATAFSKDVTACRVRDVISGILLHLALDGNTGLCARAQELAAAFVASDKSSRLRHESTIKLGTECVQRACDERMMGVRTSDLLNTTDATDSRSAQWRARLVKQLSLPAISRVDRLAGFVARYTSIKELPLTASEIESVRALAVWVGFIMTLGDVLPPMGVNGAPYLNTLVPGMQWASHRLRPKTGARVIGKVSAHTGKASAGSHPYSVRECSWVSMLLPVALRIHEETHTPEERQREWMKQLRSKEALRIVATGPPVHPEPRWPLNRVRPENIALVLIWLVTQQRPSRPRGERQRKNAEKKMATQKTHQVAGVGSRVVLYRTTQEDYARLKLVSKRAMTGINEELHDSYFVFH
jgi:hypothetical protein